ncbi:hypothetical protein C8Q77DRAFT_1160197 [Trametes polyzona]|nr:hypothetical protein C8Q77DRAFT_1160197 [Trametes polyzona]
MLGDFLVEKRGVHRRGAGVRRLNKRVFTPTAIFTQYTSDPLLLPSTESSVNPITDATTPAATTTSTPAPVNPVPPTSSSTSNTAVTTPTPATTSTTPAQTPTPTTSVLPATTSSSPVQAQQPQTTPAQAQPNTAVQHTAVTHSLADATAEVTKILTSTRVGGAAAASSVLPSPTSSTTPASNTSTGVIVGGIIAAVVGVAGILFAVVYFIRRSRKNDDGGDDDGNDFNAQAFRRQSVVLHDDAPTAMSRAMTLNRGGNTPRPPTMIERKMANTPAPFNYPTVPHPYAYNQASFAPGQIVTPGPYTPTSVNSANPFFSPYGESPIGSPVSVAPYDSAYNAQGQLITRQPSTGSPTVLSRQPSSAAMSTAQPVQEPEYVDLSRSSVTPFQAAQYAEISARLNTTPPRALPASEVAEVAEELAEHEDSAPAPPPKPVEPLELQPTIIFDESQHLSVTPTPRESSFPESPFADPTLSFHEEQLQHTPERDSFPQPPSPTFSSTSRVTSKPPTLPEIQIQQRPFSPVSLDFPVAPSTPRAVPSPLASTFSMPSPPPDAHFTEKPVPASEPAPAPATAPAPRAQATGPTPMAKRPDTVYTLYDEEDAYAGI